jgi:ATP-dependent DNA ligase
MVKASSLVITGPMEARSAAELPQGKAWWFEPKWDGFRCLAFKEDGEVRLMAKSGKPLTRYFPEVVDILGRTKQTGFILGGELLVASGGRFSFDALQMRLHPAASRIRRLSLETPAVLTCFDLLASPGGDDLRAAPLSERRRQLLAVVQAMAAPQITVTPGTIDRDLALSWLGQAQIEGVVAKRLDGPYLEGERAMVKVKRVRTADCVVGGFRYAADGDLVGSLLLGLYDDAGLLNHVGFTSGLAAADKPALTRRLEALKGEPGFTGDKPGGPSRWSNERSAQWTPLRPEMVVEVSFDHVSAGRFRHGTRLLRFRPDKAPDQCRMIQIQ